MLCATISLPLPLSPVTSTFASDLATRSISARKATMTGLWPSSRTLALDAAVKDAGPMDSSVRKAFDYQAMLLAKVDETRANFISIPACAQRDGADFYFRGKRLPSKVESKAPPTPDLCMVCRLDQDTRLTDVEHLD